MGWKLKSISARASVKDASVWWSRSVALSVSYEVSFAFPSLISLGDLW